MPRPSGFPFIVTAAPGLDLPADSGLSGKVVLRFGGVSSGKSGRNTGKGLEGTPGPGDLSRDVEDALHIVERLRPAEVEGPFAADN